MRAFIVSLYVILFSLAVSANQDFNALGFAAYQKKKYKKALNLFETAIQKDPKNAFAWLNQARSIVALNSGKEPKDYCQYDENWMYLALNSLTNSVEADPKKVFPKIEASDEPHFKKFKETQLFKKWNAAVSPLPDSEAKLKDFLVSHDWYIKNPGQILLSVEVLKTGKFEIRRPGADKSEVDGIWKVNKDKVELKFGKKSSTRMLAVKDFYFDEGKKHIKTLSLEASPGDEWRLGPFTEDCEE